MTFNSTSRGSFSSDVWSIFVFLLLLFAIVTNAILAPDGFVARDGSNYLRLAQQLLNGGGYVGPVYDVTGQGGGEPVLFAIWPIGYPTLVALVAWMSGLTVFWASKLINVMLVAGLLWMLRRQLGQAHYFAWPLLFAANIHLFSSSASEAPFMVLLVALALSLNHVVQCESVSLRAYLYVVGCVMGLFLIRYIGAFGVGVVGLVALYCLLVQRQPEKFLGLGLVALSCGVLIVGYLINNALHTGFPTGMARIAAPESGLDLAVIYLRALATELVPFRVYGSNFTLLAAGLLSLLWAGFYWRFRTVLQPVAPTQDTLSILLVAIGLLYIVAMLILRAMAHFDNIGFRFLAPGSLLLIYALVLRYQRLPASKPKTMIAVAVTLISLFSYVIVLHSTWKVSQHGNYKDTIQKIQDDFGALNDGDVVIFGPIHLNYLFPEIQNRRPFRHPYSREKEHWSDFVTRLQTSPSISSIYLNVPDNPITEGRGYHSSVVEVVNSYESNGLMKIAPPK